ncbi:hypothetical protein VTL71DRAFT_1208, partial [Oculimacula yallundae]
MVLQDDWPTMADGTSYDGKQLLHLVRTGNSPFEGVWDVELLIREIEENLNTEVTDILTAQKGSNNYGFNLATSDGSNIVARLARGDVNMPDFDGFAIEKQVPEAQFEAAVYTLLASNHGIRASTLLYYRVPVQNPPPRDTIPEDLTGRRLFVFKRAEGVNNVWTSLTADNKLALLDQLACMRAALFHYELPLDFASQYLLDRMFDFKPETLSMPVASTREFWMHVLESKINATIKNEGDMIGWKVDEETVGPIALAAKMSLLRALPHILPQETTDVPLYRLVLEHGDFGIHNTSITTDTDGTPIVTSLYDWETGCIVPALLSDPLVAVSPVDLFIDANGGPAVTRIPKDPTPLDLETYADWSRHYFKKLYSEAPDYKSAIRAGKDVRYLWFALRDWHGGDSEEFFGNLGTWAEQRIKESEAA